MTAETTVRPTTEADADAVAAIMVGEWGDVRLATTTFGLLDATTLPGLVAETEGELVGLLTWQREGDTVHLVTINAFTGGGVGSALVRALLDTARDTAGPVRRVLVTTTNDNTRALRFYQRAGFRLCALHVGAVAEARRLKPQIPETGQDGIPLRDELELEYIL